MKTWQKFVFLILVLVSIDSLPMHFLKTSPPPDTAQSPTPPRMILGKNDSEQHGPPRDISHQKEQVPIPPAQEEALFFQEGSFDAVQDERWQLLMEDIALYEEGLNFDGLRQLESSPKKPRIDHIGDALVRYNAKVAEKEKLDHELVQRLSTFCTEEDALACLSLIQKGADPKLCHDTHKMVVAVRECNYLLCFFLLEHGASIQVAFKSAIEVNNKSFVKALCEKGYDKNIALLEAAEQKHSSIIALLLAMGADVNAQKQVSSKQWQSVLSLAGIRKPALTLDLISKGADIFNPSVLGLLSKAAQHGSIEILEVLLEKGGDPNETVSYKGLSALHKASRGLKARHTQACGLLLAYGADVNCAAYSHADRTPLMEAIDNKTLPTVQLLLSHGASPFARIRDGHTALAKAAALGRQEILKIVVVYAPLICARDSADTSKTRIITFLCSLRRLGMHLPKDLRLMVIPQEDLQAFIAQNILDGKALQISFLNYAYNIWRRISEPSHSLLMEAQEQTLDHPETTEIIRLTNPQELYENYEQEIKALVKVKKTRKLRVKKSRKSMT